MTIEEQIAQLEAMYETLGAIRDTAEAERRKAHDRYVPYDQACLIARMRVKGIEELLWRLRHPHRELGDEESMEKNTTWRDELPMKAVL